MHKCLSEPLHVLKIIDLLIISDIMPIQTKAQSMKEVINLRDIKYIFLTADLAGYSRSGRL